MKRYTHVIWDFNGTVLDDLGVTIRSINRLLTAHGLSPLPSVEAYRAVFGFPIQAYYQRLGFDFSVTPFPELAVEWVGYYMDEFSRDARVYPDLPEATAAVRRKGISQIILSATEFSMLSEQIRVLGIANEFDEILGMDNIHAASKEQIALAWRSRNPDATPLVIGDTDHDAAVAAAINADCVLLTCGHQSQTRLAACHPLSLAPSPLTAVKGIIFTD